jgi:hypothetical protein
MGNTFLTMRFYYKKLIRGSNKKLNGIYDARYDVVIVFLVLAIAG